MPSDPLPDESPRPQRRPIEIVQWIAVLPAAILGGWAAHLFCTQIVRFLISTVGLSSESAVIGFVFLVLGHLPQKVAFVVAGAEIAPHARRTTAIVLAVVAAIMSLLIHLLVQSRIGSTNFAHFTAEAIGAALGVVIVARIETWRRRSPSGETRADSGEFKTHV